LRSRIEDSDLARSIPVVQDLAVRDVKWVERFDTITWRSERRRGAVDSR
jgi:hypothetical protein